MSQNHNLKPGTFTLKIKINNEKLKTTNYLLQTKNNKTKNNNKNFET